VQRKEVDMAVSTITMLQTRNVVVDFSFPYDYDGMHVIEKAPTIEAPGLRTPTVPFTVETWIGMAVAFLAITIALHVSMTASAKFNESLEALAKRPGFKSEVMLYVLNSLTR
jgi:hypothetical protein